MKAPKPRVVPQKKSATGVSGFDEVTGGGLPTGCTTLLVGGPGSGKTILSLQFLVHGAEHCGDPGIFVAFEETPERIAQNFAGFGWNLAMLARKNLAFIDAKPKADVVQAGSFDLSGMLAMLGAKAKQMGARRIVFDALDILVTLLPDPAARRREIFRVHEWLIERQLTAIITAKAGSEETQSLDGQPFGFMQYMVDCAVVLNHRVSQGVSQRNLRVQKFRGSAFDENESPFVIGRNGFDVAVARTTESCKGELKRARLRMRELRGGDVAFSKVKAQVKKGRIR